MRNIHASYPTGSAGRRGAVERADYFIDRFRVSYQGGGGWICGCADFAASDACRHTREAAGRLAAQMSILERIGRGSLQVVESKSRGRGSNSKSTRTSA
jgi:hypothetical protein